jgi:hypothetical protein
MTRYFFEACLHGHTVMDDVGEQFCTLQEAEAHAVVVANELSRNNSQTIAVRVVAGDRMPTVSDYAINDNRPREIQSDTCT